MDVMRPVHAKLLIVVMGSLMVSIGLACAYISGWLAWHAVTVRFAPLTALFGVVFVAVSLWFSVSYAIATYKMVRDYDSV